MESRKHQEGLNIKPEWKVLDVGSGHQPNRRANVIIDKYTGDTIHRTTAKIEMPDDKYFILGDALFLHLLIKSLMQ